MMAARAGDQGARRFSVQQRSAHEKRTVRKSERVHQREQCAKEKTDCTKEIARKKKYCVRGKTARVGIT